MDMSSKAIDARISEVSQLRKLGLSIAKAKPIAKPTVEPIICKSASAIDCTIQYWDVGVVQLRPIVLHRILDTPHFG